MDNHQERINKLHERIDALLKQQEFFGEENFRIKKECRPTYGSFKHAGAISLRKGKVLH